MRALHGSETCVRAYGQPPGNGSTLPSCRDLRAHEQVVVDGGLTGEHVQDAARIAAVVHAGAVTLDGVAAAFDDAHLPLTQATA